MSFAHRTPGGPLLASVLPDAEVIGDSTIHVTSCSCDSRQVLPGDIFIAIVGSNVDGHDHVEEAIARGASALVVERYLPGADVPQFIVEESREAHGVICQAIAGDPSQRVKVIGVTGTNGKTTTTHLVSAILEVAGNRTGRIGTLDMFDGWESAPASLTTPAAPVLADWLGRMAGTGCTHAAMEVSSHSIAQRRVAGIAFDVACFTNFRQDHLDYHGTIEKYHQTKKRLLEHLSPDGAIVVNADDPVCAAIAESADRPVITFAIDAEADVTASIIERHLGEQTFLITIGNETVAVRTRMIGDHHVANCLAAAAIAHSYDISLDVIAEGLQVVEQVPGRLERVSSGHSPAVYVDYAHTPDALASVLATLREVTEGNVWCVFGAGGDREREKRPLMGAVAQALADKAVLTSDNPRGEDPRAIAAAILRGCQVGRPVHVELDRAAAIEYAIMNASPGDTVLIAGKGHEAYQIIGKNKYYFDDREIAREILEKLQPEETTAWVMS